MGYRTAMFVVLASTVSGCTCGDLTAFPYDLTDAGADAADARHVRPDALILLDAGGIDGGRDAAAPPVRRGVLTHIFAAPCGGPVVAADINQNGRAELYCSTVLPGRVEPATARVVAIAWERGGDSGEFHQVWNHEAYGFVPWHAADLGDDERSELIGYHVDDVAFQAWAAVEPNGFPARLVLDVREPGPHRRFVAAQLDGDATPEIVFEFGLRVWELDGGRPRFATIDRATGGNAAAFRTTTTAMVAGIDEALPPRLVTFTSVANGEYWRIGDEVAGLDTIRWLTAGELDQQPGDEIAAGGWMDGSPTMQFQVFTIDEHGQPHPLSSFASQERVDLHGRVAALAPCESDGIPPSELAVATWSTVRLLDVRLNPAQEVARTRFGVSPRFIVCADTDGDGHDEVIVSAERDGWDELHVFESQFP